MDYKLRQDFVIVVLTKVILQFGANLGDQRETLQLRYLVDFHYSVVILVLTGLIGEFYGVTGNRGLSTTLAPAEQTFGGNSEVMLTLGGILKSGLYFGDRDGKVENWSF